MRRNVSGSEGARSSPVERETAHLLHPDPHGTGQTPTPSEHPSRLFTPVRALVIFMGINFITYYDRGAIAGALTDIKADSSMKSDGKGLSDAKAGSLVSAFMVGYVIFSPIFASLAGRIPPPRIVVIGLAAWSLATLWCSFSKNYISLLLARCCVGIGEAAYCGFIPTMIDDLAPPERRTLFIGLFFAMIPVGQAVGMAMGGTISANVTMGWFSGWQTAFLTESFFAVPFMALMMAAPRTLGTGVTKKVKPKQKLQQPAIDHVNAVTPESVPIVPPSPTWSVPPSVPAPDDDYPSLGEAVKTLGTNKMYMLTALGYAMYTFVLGGIAAFGISYLEQGPLDLSDSVAPVAFGLITAVTGVIGSAFGGWFVDFIGGSTGWNGVLKCGIFNTIMVTLSIPCGLAAFGMRSRPAFFIFCFFAELTLFATTAPVNASLLEVVSSKMRIYAMSGTNFLIHVVGDVPSPLLVGVLSDSFDKGCRDLETQEKCVAAYEKDDCKWISRKGDDSICVNEYQLRNALLIVFVILSAATLLWGTASLLARRRLRKEEEEEDEEAE
eukprot:Sspe_Gene.45895::Locus_22795_Transcript_2_2_Confidence_0.667_Length_1802::g.45895::m.45895